MRRFLALLLAGLGVLASVHLVHPALADLAPLEITEEDASPSTFPYQVKFTNGTVTDNGDGTTSVSSGGSSTSPGSPQGSNQFNRNGSFAGSARWVFNEEADTVMVSGVHLVAGASHAATLNTGQGDNELYDMNQNVQTTDSPTFVDLTLAGAGSDLTIQATGADAIGFHSEAGVPLRIINETDSQDLIRVLAANTIETVTRLITTGGATLNGAVNAGAATSVTLPRPLTIGTASYVFPPVNSSGNLENDGAGNLSWVAGAGSGDITSVGNVASGAAFDGTQGTVLTFNNAGGDATLDYDGTDLQSSVLLRSPGAAFTGDVDVDASNPNITLQHTGGTEQGWHAEAGDISYIREAGGPIWIIKKADDSIGIGEVGAPATKFTVSTDGTGNQEVQLPSNSIGQAEINWADCELTRSIYVENLAAADDNFSMGSWDRPVTIKGIWVNFKGTGTTPAEISLEDGSGNAMTHGVPQALAEGTIPNRYEITAGGGLSAREVLRFDVDNAVSPETDEYTITVAYTYDN